MRLSNSTASDRVLHLAPLPFGAGSVTAAPYRGAPQTVGLLKEAALDSQNDLAVREVAEMACEGIDSKDYVSECLAIHYMLLRMCRYMRDPKTVELVKSPAVICKQLLAGRKPQIDCDEFTALEGALNLSVGASCRFVTVAFRPMFYRGQQQFSHVFDQFLNPANGTWVTVDPVAAEKTPDMLRRVVAAKTWAVA